MVYLYHYTLSVAKVRMDMLVAKSGFSVLLSHKLVQLKPCLREVVFGKFLLLFVFPISLIDNVTVFKFSRVNDAFWLARYDIAIVAILSLVYTLYHLKKKCRC